MRHPGGKCGQLSRLMPLATYRASAEGPGAGLPVLAPPPTIGPPPSSPAEAKHGAAKTPPWQRGKVVAVLKPAPGAPPLLEASQPAVFSGEAPAAAQQGQAEEDRQYWQDKAHAERVARLTQKFHHPEGRGFLNSAIIDGQV